MLENIKIFEDQTVNLLNVISKINSWIQVKRI